MLNCFEINEKFWKFIGVHPNRSDNIYSLTYSNLVVTILIFGYTLISTFNLYFIPLKLDIIIEEMMLYFTMIVVCAKASSFLFMRGKIMKLLHIQNGDLFNIDTDMEQQILNEANNFNKKSWKIYAGVSYLCNLTHVLSPLAFHLMFNVQLDLPVSGYYFLSDVVKQRYFYLIYFYQSIGIHFHMLVNVNIDSFILGTMILLIAQLDILGEKLYNITNVKILQLKGGLLKSEEKSIKEYITVLKLNKTIVHYHHVIEFCNLIEDFFSFILFVQFSAASGIICVCLFRFTLPATGQYYIFLSTYILLMTVQTLIPSWFGTKIMEKSTYLSQAIYGCDWTPRSRRFKNSMKLFIERSNRPLSITGCKMFRLSLTTFTSIMNTAYSFFTLLRHIQAREA